MQLFAKRPKHPCLIGVVHLQALPGAPVGASSLQEVIERALKDAQTLVAGGADGLIVENYGDAPFAASEVDLPTVAMMTRIATEISTLAKPQWLGINVLRNDATAALSVALASHAHFIRVNVHTGVMATDQGIITGEARATLQLKKRFELSTKIAADVHVKHASPLTSMSIGQTAKDTYYRGKADALIVTGKGTGAGVDLQDLQEVQSAVPEAPIWIGSGIHPDNLSAYLGLFDTAIVGTCLHRNGQISEPVELRRVEEMAKLFRR
jgi:uncharacterized protein